MSERQIRGDVVNGYLKYVRKSWGSDGVDACCQAAGIKGLDLLPKEYYDNAIMTKILQWIAATHGMDKVQSAGYFTVQNLGILAYLVRFLDMRSMLAKAEERYSQAYTFGRVNVYLETWGARATLTDFSDCKENCVGWLGALEAMMDMTKTKGTVVESKCQLEGAPCCEFTLKWKK